MNGQDHPSHSVHVFHVGKMRIKLSRGWITKAREIYSSSMQVLFLASRYFWFHWRWSWFLLDLIPSIVRWAATWLRLFIMVSQLSIYDDYFLHAKKAHLGMLRFIRSHPFPWFTIICCRSSCQKWIGAFKAYGLRNVLIFSRGFRLWLILSF